MAAGTGQGRGYQTPRTAYPRRNSESARLERSRKAALGRREPHPRERPPVTAGFVRTARPARVDGEPGGPFFPAPLHPLAMAGVPRGFRLEPRPMDLLRWLSGCGAAHLR